MAGRERGGWAMFFRYIYYAADLPVPMIRCIAHVCSAQSEFNVTPAADLVMFRALQFAT
jgi:hypothetical protein